MNDKSLNKALEIVGTLMKGEQIEKSTYEEYTSNGEIYDAVALICKNFNLDIYEYNYGLYLSAGYNNRLFGYSNEELKKYIGIKQNRELYLCYFITYAIITCFYRDSAGYTYVEYVKNEDVIKTVDTLLKSVTSKLSVVSLNEAEEDSFKALALLWEDLPMVVNEETTLRAARGSKMGFVKLTFNFLSSQELLVENQGRYYPSERFKALIENYFDEYKGRLYEIMKGDV